MDKRKNIYKKIVLYADNNILQLSILFLCLLLLIAYFIISKLDVLTLFDITIISTVIVTFIATVSFETLINRIRPLVEDDIKLDYSIDFKKIYPLSVNKLYTDKNGHTWPLEIIYDNSQFNNIIIQDSLNKYQLPSIIEKHMETILKVNKSSSIINNTMIRIDDISLEKNSLKLSTSRTDYLSTLITNRSMDCKLIDDITIRNFLEPGPYYNHLNESKLSNHLGFNLLLKTKTNDYVFVQRSEFVSTAKNKISVSVSGSVKCKYALNENYELTYEGIENSIKNEIFDELGLSWDLFDVELHHHVIAFYREMIEGGKPHLFLVIETNIDNRTFMKAFYNKKVEKEVLDKDSRELIFVNKDELAQFNKDYTIKINNKKYFLAETTLGIISYYINENILRH